MPGFAEGDAEGKADVAEADDADPHPVSLGAGAGAPGRRKLPESDADDAIHDLKAG
jgi:hypothetical protein